MNFFTILSEWISTHPGQALGAFLGFVVGLLILIFGPVKALLVIILSAIGFILGKLFDDKIALPFGLGGSSRDDDIEE